MFIYKPDGQWVQDTGGGKGGEWGGGGGGLELKFDKFDMWMRQNEDLIFFSFL